MCCLLDRDQELAVSAMSKAVEEMKSHVAVSTRESREVAIEMRGLQQLVSHQVVESTLAMEG